MKQLIYQPQYISENEKAQILSYLKTLYPIWEMRYSASNPPPEGQTNRMLLRPVYWLGNWQFACLNYYHPPKGIEHRCVKAEGYPPVLENLVQRIESKIQNEIAEKDIPKGWHLNTCLINYYGDLQENEKWLDCARVGEHKDFEPGPVASVSIGEKALFQFVESQNKSSLSKVFLQQWLEDCSLQIFAGEKFKKKLFHRVQRVERKSNFFFALNNIQNFKTRRINFTFRYVPLDHIQPAFLLPTEKQRDIIPYMTMLSAHSQHFETELKKIKVPKSN